MKLAEWLSGDIRVSRVLYAGLPSHPGHAIAKSQMDGGFGGMLTFEVRGDFAKTKKVCESTKLFQLAVSLGAVESLIEQPASMSHASYDAAARAAFGITDGLIRLSVGLEAFEDLRDELDRLSRPFSDDPAFQAFLKLERLSSGVDSPATMP